MFCIIAVAADADAQSVRHRFEPTDLELEDQGTLDVDVQSGFTVGLDTGPGTRSFPRRWVVADVELDLGITSNVELDLDGALYHEADRTWSSDPLWLCAKLGLADVRAVDGARSAAFGIQIGPRLPFVNAGSGIGYGALALVGLTLGRNQLVVNAGGIVDPGDEVSARRGRPVAALLGLNGTRALGASVDWIAQVGGVVYADHDAHELQVGTGLAWSANDHVDLSFLVMGGVFANGDRGVFLLGASPKTDLW